MGRIDDLLAQPEIIAIGERHAQARRTIAQRRLRNAYRTLDVQLTDPRTGKRTQDIVITAIMRLRDPDAIKGFYRGYVEDIRTRPERYPAKARRNAAGYAREDISLALGMHFDGATADLWERTLPELALTGKYL